MEHKQTDYELMWIGASAVFALSALLYVYAYCAEILQKQEDGETVHEATLTRVVKSVPYFMPLIEAILDKFDGKCEESLPQTALAPTLSIKLGAKKIGFQHSVNSTAASPHFEDDFFFADI
jgi:hypothetical protein